MLSLFRALLFVAIAYLEISAIVNLALKSDSLQRNAYNIGTDLCYSQPGMKYYTQLPESINQLLCSLNMLFVAAAHGPKPVQLQMGTFGGLFTATIIIVIYESFRPVHRRSNFVASIFGRAASFFLLLGQRCTAGFAAPIQLALSTWSTSSGLANTRARRNTDDEILKALLPESKYIWATLFAIIGGYIVPSLYMQLEKYSYFSLAIWHPFPAYIWVLLLVLTPIFKVLPNTPALATSLLAALGIFGSLGPHIELLKETVFGTYDIRDVFLLRPPADTTALSVGAHLVFQIDFIGVLATTALAVLTGPGATLAGFIPKLLTFVLVSALAGPGAGALVVWALREFGLQRAYATAVKVKKSQ